MRFPIVAGDAFTDEDATTVQVVECPLVAVCEHTRVTDVGLMPNVRNPAQELYERDCKARSRITTAAS
jgi:hypothetical protein